MKRRLPPGSLSIASSLRALFDRSYYVRCAERYGPVFVTRQHHRPTVCVVGLERGHRLLREHEGSLRGATLRYSQDVTGGFLRYMEGDTHQRYNGVFRKALGPAVVDAAEPVVRDIARRELHRLADECARRGAVAPGPYCGRVSVDAVAHTLFGVVPGDPVYDALFSAYRPIAKHNMSRRLGARAKEALATLRAQLVARADRLRSAEDEGGCLGAMARMSPDLPDGVCIDNLIFTQRNASGDVAGLLCWMLALTGSHRSRDEADGRLTECLMLETLRLAQSEYLYRTILEDIEFEGYVLPRGWLLRIGVWESHRDPAVFDEPERFDPDRFCGRPLSQSEYAPFGWGAHHCLGVGLTTMICRAVFGELEAGFAWEVEWDGRPARRRMHWHHWRPSSTLRVSVRPA